MNINPLLDTILDRTVFAGYTRVGYRLRARGWRSGDLQPMHGKVVLVTGATSGLGLAAAQRFAGLGAEVWLLARNRERGERARRTVAQHSGNGDVSLGLCDISDLKSVRQFATHFSQQAKRLDVLVNNAGVLTDDRALSADGLELTFATNVLGPFLLTSLLAGLLRKSRPARVINVSSGGMYTQRIQIGDLQSTRGEFDGAAVYARTKRAEVILTELWAQRLADSGVVVHSMHPGWADTPGIRSSLPAFHTATKRLLRTPDQGADTIVWLASAEEPARSSGGFWHDRVERPTHLLPWTKETPLERERLWAECERLSGAVIA